MTAAADPPRPDAEAIRRWAKHRLDDRSGTHVGRVEGLYKDERTGEPAWLVARMGRIGHYAVIPASDAVEGAAHVWVPFTREQIRRAPRIDTDAPLTVATEREILTHYELGAPAGRMAALAGLGEAEVSARRL